MKAQIDAGRAQQLKYNQMQPGFRKSVELGRSSPQIDQVPTAASTISRQFEHQSARSQTSYMHKRNSSQGAFNRQSLVVVKSPELSSPFLNPTSPARDVPSSGEIDLKANSQNVVKMLQKVQKKNKQTHLEAVPNSHSRPSSK